MLSILKRALTGSTPGPKIAGRGRYRNARFHRDREFVGLQFTNGADFSGAQFKRTVTFRNVVFRGTADFSRTRFDATVQFESVQFLAGVSFRSATFTSVTFVKCLFDGRRVDSESLLLQEGDGFITFNEAVIATDVTFRNCEFRTLATFTGVKIDGDLNAWHSSFDRIHINSAKIGRIDIAQCRFNHFFGLYGSQVEGYALCQGCLYEWPVNIDATTFHGVASFANNVVKGHFGAQGVVFKQSASLTGSRFASNLNLRGMTSDGNVSMRSAQFNLTEFGPMFIAGELDLSESVFDAAATLQVTARRVVLRRSAFREGGFVLVQGAEVALEGAVFDKLTVVGSGGQFGRYGLAEAPGVGIDALPTITTLNRTDVTNLVLSDVDLRECRFLGARNLDRLRMEGTALLTYQRKWVGRRQAIADEADITTRQARRSLRRRRSPVNVQLPIDPSPQFVPGQVVTIRSRLSDSELVPQPHSPTAKDVAELYRLLRKGREDVRDSPGAGDFYYGEMEMRRQAPDSSWVDRLVLSTYWLVSGYGLHASRALLAFILTVVIFAGCFWYVGFQSAVPSSVDGYLTALRTAFLSATSLLRPPPAGLSSMGEVLDAGLRLIGSVLLGLALFSLRGRIKR